MSNISTTTTSSTVIEINFIRISIQRFGHPLLFTVGMIGTLLNIAIFSRHSMRKNSCALYFYATSWANFVCLTWGVLASMLAFFTNNNPAAYNVVYCKIRFYMINFGQYSSRAFVILACLDRFLLCSTSGRQRNFCRPKIAKRVIPVTTLICACLATYVLIGYMPGQRIIPCSISTSAGTVYETISSWLFLLTIPALSMIIFSGLIIKRLKENGRRVGRDQIRVAGKDVQLAGMLIGQVVLYLLTNIPYVSLVLYGNLTQSVPTSSKSAERVAIESFLNTLLASSLYYCFNALSFYVYTLTAPSFRRELLAMILPRQYLQKIHPMNNQGTLTLTQARHPAKQTHTVFLMKEIPKIGKSTVHP